MTEEARGAAANNELVAIPFTIAPATTTAPTVDHGNCLSDTGERIGFPGRHRSDSQPALESDRANGPEFRDREQRGHLLAASGNGDTSASSAALQSSAESDVQDAAVASLVSGSPIGILPESLVNALAQDRLQS